jgi:branched-chain amino acid transport system substrate-binding protein
MAYEAPRRWPNKKRFYQINPNYAYGKACAKIFKEIVSKNVPGAEFVGESWPPLGNRDFVGYITSILAAKPDILQCTVYGSDLMSFLKQGEPYGLLQKVQMVCSEVGHQENAGMFKKGDIGAPIGVLCASLYDWYNQKGEEIASLAKYVYDKTGYYPGLLTRFSTLTFLKGAIEKAGSATDIEKIANSLEGLTFNSPFGGPVTIRACDHQTTPDYKVGILGWDETGKYNFPIIKTDTIHVLPGKMLHHTCEEIMALRAAEAKKTQ